MLLDNVTTALFWFRNICLHLSKLPSIFLNIFFLQVRAKYRHMFFCQGTIYLPISKCISVVQVCVQFTQERVFGAWQKETSVKFLLRCGTDSKCYANIHMLLYKYSLPLQAGCIAAIWSGSCQGDVNKGDVSHVQAWHSKIYYMNPKFFSPSLGILKAWDPNDIAKRWNFSHCLERKDLIHIGLNGRRK